VNPGDAEHTHLNIVDLHENKLLYSLPDPNPGHKLIWSPVSDKLIYRDDADGWILVDLSKMEVLPVTMGGGKQVDKKPAWSFDGRYLGNNTFIKHSV
jgi:hypothetical protein